MKCAVAACLFLLTNLVCFLLMLRDKRLAKKGGRRIPERTLFLSAACFGAVGGTLAMRLFRHKTQHRQFRIFFPLMMLPQILLFAFVCWIWLV